VLRKEGICLQRQWSWYVSTDPEFTAKAADVVGLYLNPPVNALVLSIDEKPSMQAIERKTGYVMTDNGKIVRGLKSKEELRSAIGSFVKAYGPTAKPFLWRKREVKGSQTRNTIVNLCN
jgi:hypothetical protein